MSIKTPIVLLLSNADVISSVDFRRANYDDMFGLNPYWLLVECLLMELTSLTLLAYYACLRFTNLLHV